AAAGEPERRAEEAERRRVRLDRALDVPLGVELAQALADLVLVVGVVLDAEGDLALDAAVDLLGGVTRDAVAGARHGFLLSPQSEQGGIGSAGATGKPRGAIRAPPGKKFAKCGLVAGTSSGLVVLSG